MKEIDLAYAAGIIDGEGSISIVKNKDNRCIRGYTYRLVIMVSMVTPEIPHWLHDLFGGRLATQRRLYTTHAMDITHWCLSARQSLKFLQLILPYLKSKLEQAKVAIEYQSIKKYGGYVSDIQVLRESQLFNKLRQLKKKEWIFYEEIPS